LNEVAEVKKEYSSGDGRGVWKQKEDRKYKERWCSSVSIVVKGKGRKKDSDSFLT